MASTEVRPTTRRRHRRPSSNGSGSRPFLPPSAGVAEPFRLTPQLALRIAILGGIAITVFGVLFFRLWALQVLSGPQYLHAALNNQLRSVPLEAPRGPIVDRDGRTIVDNRAATAVQLWTADLPKTWRARLNELRRLSTIINVPVAEMVAELKKRGGDPATPVTVQESIHKAQYLYLQERGRDFPGVRLAPAYVRGYPYQSLAAQVLGNVGPISPGEYKLYRKKGYRLSDKIGQGGIEARYDAYLRGKDGLAQLRVDAFGRPRGGQVIEQSPTPGEAVRLTLDMNLQRAAERGIRAGIVAAHASDCVGCWASNGGAIVALDPRDGSILALASNPTFQPGVFNSHDPRKLAPLLNARVAREDNYPAVDRAIAGLYPAGSTYKPVTALAALEERLVSPTEPLPCTGVYHVYDKQGHVIPGGTFKNWDPFVSQEMTLPTALAASCDTYFYELGYRFYKLPASRRHPFQEWAARFGFGHKTGVDLPGELPGLLPTPEWRRAHYKDPVDKLWKPGDSIQLAIGQKDLLVTPLQMARFYAMIANGGRLVRPHIAADVEEVSTRQVPGRVLHSFAPPPAQTVKIDPVYLDAVRQGLYQATHASDGTATSVFGTFPIPIAGKTGTAEKNVSIPGFTGKMDQSEWCGYAPADAPTIVVCALIENGGHGGTAAAPAALKVFEAYFKTQPTLVSVPTKSD
ncbi:MAG TPA: penicillin-binding protein 2 [Gaiellaceae bacterium]|nr:penicillin-binding protein 2 [Gaiellaceae bacterium]